jgi:uncharacterized caspase-like protein
MGGQGLISRLLAVVMVAAASLANPARAEPPPALNGVALVIGQSEYEHIAPLPNPANDARDMMKLLTDLGFDTRLVSDRDSRRLGRDLERFVEDAEGADVAFVYYSGHGIEAGGDNWLVPIDTDAEDLQNARETLVSTSRIIEDLAATVPVTVVLLDACRTNPFPAGSLLRPTPTGSPKPIGDGGLMPVRGAKALGGKADTGGKDGLGLVLGFAAEPGSPALDGPPGGNSPYAAALTRHLGAIEGVEFGAVMRMVTEEVYLSTGARQRPWINENLRRFLYFGMVPDAPEGDAGLITGERRRLLLTMSELPQENRVQVETAAARGRVPLDALYGVMRALGTEKIPEDPAELDAVLTAQAERLRDMIAERDALKAEDPEILRLSASADNAIRQGAVETARKFLDDAVARVEATSEAVDDAEEVVRRKRIADAAVYARRGDAASLTFDFAAAAADYRRAADLVARWDDKLLWNYSNQAAEALRAHGEATGDLAALEASVAAYETILDMIPRGDDGRDGAITSNNLAVVYQSIGEREEKPDNLEKAAQIFRETLAVFEREKDEANAAAALNNIGNVLLKLGQRDARSDRLVEAVASFRAALDKRPREKDALEWAGTQNNIGITLYTLAERDGDPARLREAETAYRLALEEYTRARSPVQWAMVQNNLGNTLGALGATLNDRAMLDASAAAFRSALEVRTRAHFPLSWARTRLNLGNALSHATRFDLGTATLEEAIAATRDALEVFTRDAFPLDWATSQNNLGSLLQTLGQRRSDVALLRDAADAFRSAARIYTRKAFPLDWAMTRYNLGNTQLLMGGFENDANRYREAVSSYDQALTQYRRDVAPKQWALTMAGKGSALHWVAMQQTGTDALKASIAARRAALEVLTAEDAPVDWANAQNGLGMSLINLSTLEQDSRHLKDASTALEASLAVFTREAQPLQWAFAQNNLGDVHWNLAAMGGGRAEYERAKSYFQLARQGFEASGYTSPIPITDQKLQLVQSALDKM